MKTDLENYIQKQGKKKAGWTPPVDEAKNCLYCAAFALGKSNELFGRCCNRNFLKMVRPVAAVQQDLFEQHIKVSLELSIAVHPNFGCKYFH